MKAVTDFLKGHPKKVVLMAPTVIRGVATGRIGCRAVHVSTDTATYNVLMTGVIALRNLTKKVKMPRRPKQVSFNNP